MIATRQAKREAKRLYRLCLVNGLLDENRARRAVQRIIATKPHGYLVVLTLFRRLVQLDRVRQTAKVESARTLPAEMQASVQRGLARIYGPGLSTSFSENPGLLGGMRIQVGSDVYDGSVKARLAALEQRF